MELRNGVEARAPGRDGFSDTGLFEFNRQDMTVEEMEKRCRDGAWTPGDLFAVFRDDLGGTHAQYSRYDDFSAVAVTQLIRAPRAVQDFQIDKETMTFLVGMLMISRIHNYQFDDFVELLDHDMRQIFDLRGLCSWIARNEHLFVSDVEAAMEAAYHEDDLDVASVA